MMSASGWYSSAIFRYAFLISRFVAGDLRWNSSKGFFVSGSLEVTAGVDVDAGVDTTSDADADADAVKSVLFVFA